MSLQKYHCSVVWSGNGAFSLKQCEMSGESVENALEQVELNCFLQVDPVYGAGCVPF